MSEPTVRVAFLVALLGAVGVSVALYQLLGGWAVLGFWSLGLLQAGAKHLD